MPRGEGGECAARSWGAIFGVRGYGGSKPTSLTESRALYALMELPPCTEGSACSCEVPGRRARKCKNLLQRRPYGRVRSWAVNLFGPPSGGLGGEGNRNPASLTFTPSLLAGHVGAEGLILAAGVFQVWNTERRA